ncbi:MAG: hypothetical protein VW549_02085 [Methylophilaceae bacterium]|jgi:hypothetical protein
MVFLRLALVILLITFLVLFIFYGVTKNKKYLYVIRSIFNYTILIGAIIGLTYLILRVLHI